MLLEVFRLSNFMNSGMQMGADILVQQEHLWISLKDHQCIHPTATGSCDCQLAIPTPRILLLSHMEGEMVREMQPKIDKKLSRKVVLSNISWAPEVNWKQESRKESTRTEEIYR